MPAGCSGETTRRSRAGETTTQPVPPGARSRRSPFAGFVPRFALPERLRILRRVVLSAGICRRWTRATETWQRKEQDESVKPRRREDAGRRQGLRQSCIARKAMSSPMTPLITQGRCSLSAVAARVCRDWRPRPCERPSPVAGRRRVRAAGWLRWSRQSTTRLRRRLPTPYRRSGPRRGTAKQHISDGENRHCLTFVRVRIFTSQCG